MGDGTALRGVYMTLNTHRRGPVRVLDAPDGHDVIIEGRLDVHTVPDIRDCVSRGAASTIPSHGNVIRAVG